MESKEVGNGRQERLEFDSKRNNKGQTEMSNSVIFSTSGNEEGQSPSQPFMSDQ